MRYSVDLSGSMEGLKELVDEVTSDKTTKALMILAADGNNFISSTLDPFLQQLPVPVFGGIFPQIIYRDRKLSTGSIVIGLETPVDLLVVDEVSSEFTEFDDLIDEGFPDIGDAQTMFIFVDGFSRRAGELIESLFNIFGLELNYIGGGAGSLRSVEMGLEQVECIITNQGLKKDCAILGKLQIKSGIGVQHGWDVVISGPHRVTEAVGNRVISVDWKPAFEFYKEIIQQHAGMVISPENFFEVAKSFPFGVAKLGAEYIVRDPFGVDKDNALIFNANIQQETFISILTGDNNSLIRAAGVASDESRVPFIDDEFEVTFIVDCISRVLFLADTFAKEIAVVGGGKRDILGILSIGEIANCGRDYLELYNKTCVVGSLAKGI